MKNKEVKIPKFCLRVLRWIPNNVNYKRKLVEKNDMEKPHTLIMEKGGRMCQPIICKESFKHLPLKERIVIEAHTGMCVTYPDEMNDVYKYMSCILGRTIYSHDLAIKKVQEELKENSKNDFLLIDWSKY